MEKLKPLPIEATVTRKIQLTHDVFELHLESNPPFLFYPGQFISIVVPGKGPGGRDLRRAYSIASGPELIRDGKSTLELCIKLVENGPGTNYLYNLEVGDTIKGIAPYGDFTYKTAPDRHALFIATGTGIAPFRSMVFSKLFQEHRPLTATLLFGARVLDDLLYVDELDQELGEKHYVKTLSRVEGDFKGFKGRVTDWLRVNMGEIQWKSTDFYLCGNGAMIDEVKQILTANGVDKTAIHQEVYYKPKPGEAHAN